MNTRITLLVVFSLFISFSFAQEEDKKDEKEEGHYNQNKFRQLYQEFATPNQYRTASGAPGPQYYQNTADYEMDIILNEKDNTLQGFETITYTNNSPETLNYLWVQLEQNVRKKDSPAKERNGDGMSPVMPPSNFVSEYMKEEFDGGFNIEEVKQGDQPLRYKINYTMMRVELPEPLESGDDFEFSIKWNYNVNNHVENRARSGYEHFDENDNNVYVIAQFFPRMAVYNDKEGWQNYQFWGSGEFALPFGQYEVNITVPEDHILEATGKLQNRKDVFSDKMMERYEKAKESYDEPVMIVNEEEAIENEKNKSTGTKTWSFEAEKVRDFAFTTSRKLIYDMMAVDINGQRKMAVSLYPKEGNPLWGKWSTKVVASTLETYSDHTFTYPYHKAISVHAKNQGMEYPMICWNYGRPNEDGSYSDRIKFGMMSVIIHEIGHNFFPMIVNSDERQWGWMDEGLNTFAQYLAEQEFAKKYPEAIEGRDKYPSRRGDPEKIVGYMKGDQDFISPIMTNPEQVYQLGNNAYGKPATALNILRETVMGEELFDYSFKEFAQRWMFKHPTPEDFFRTMEDASAVDLDWFWRGWFYTTDYVDIGVEEVNEYMVTNTPTKEGKELLARYGITDPSNNPRTANAVYVKEITDSTDVSSQEPLENAPKLNEYLMDNFSEQERQSMEVPEYFYEVTFNKPGGLVMPLIVEYTYEDDTSELVKYPVQVWRKNDQAVTKTVASNKRIKAIVVDPNLETADIDKSNNQWPEEEKKSDFDKFEEEKKKD